MEDITVEGFKPDDPQLESHGGSLESDESWGQEFFQDKDKEGENAGFAAAVRSVFPMGISNATREQGAHSSGESAAMVTPYVQRQTVLSSRGGRGGSGQRSHIQHHSSASVRNGMSNENQVDKAGHAGETDEVQILGTRITNANAGKSNEFRTAGDKLRDEEKRLSMLPEKNQPTLTSVKTYSYVAELQFNKPLSEKGQKMENSKEFSIPTCLGQWIRRTREISPELIIHPYKAESKCNPITHEDQIPIGDEDAMGQYYHNHRVDNGGILKGMIRFTTIVPWATLKNQQNVYFKWLYNNRVYIRHTSFDADTVVLLGYLQGQHPDAANLADVTRELKERLKLTPGLDFQVTPRNLTVQDSPVTKTKFNFRALAIETDGKMAAEIREYFFRLGDPKTEKHLWPITGTSLFVPMFRTASWPTENIAAMAKLHSSTVSRLEQIFIDNVYDIDRKMVFKEPGGTETWRSLREAIQSLTNQAGDENVVHSAHNTNRDGVIRILVNSHNAAHARDFFSQLQDQLRATISAADLHEITQGKIIQMTARTYESSDSKKYASYAEAMLRENPQNGEQSAVPPPQRKKSRMEVSYSNAAKRGHEEAMRNKNPHETNADNAKEEDTDSEWEEYGDSFWEKKVEAGFTKLFGDQPPLRADEMERKMRELINKQAEESERHLDRKFANMSTELRNMTEKENNKSKRMICNLFDRQNQVLYNLTLSLQESLLNMHENMRDIASATKVRLTHNEIPRIDIPEMSFAPRSPETGPGTGGGGT